MPRSVIADVNVKLRTKRTAHRTQQQELRKNQRARAISMARILRRRGFGKVTVDDSNSGSIDVIIEHFPGRYYQAIYRYFWTDTSTIPPEGLLLSQQGRGSSNGLTQLGQLPTDWCHPTTTNRVIQLLVLDCEVCAKYPKD